jgi:hypothetical protein
MPTADAGALATKRKAGSTKGSEGRKPKGRQSLNSAELSEGDEEGLLLTRRGVKGGKKKSGSLKHSPAVRHKVLSRRRNKSGKKSGKKKSGSLKKSHQNRKK